MLLERLKKVRAKIESGWTTGVLARDSGGAVVKPDDPAACRWCLVGAISAETENISQYLALINALQKKIGHRLTGWNDGHTKEEALALLDNVIAEVENGIS